MPKTQKTLTTINLKADPELHEAIKERAWMERSTLQDTVARALQHYLDTTEPPQVPQYNREIPRSMSR